MTTQESDNNQVPENPRALDRRAKLAWELAEIARRGGKHTLNPEAERNLKKALRMLYESGGTPDDPEKT